jgi:hypothetical protein
MQNNNPLFCLLVNGKPIKPNYGLLPHSAINFLMPKSGMFTVARPCNEQVQLTVGQYTLAFT